MSQEQLHDAKKYSVENFDKNVIYIASGSLAISFAFIKDIIHLSRASNKEELTFSWAIFAFVIFLNLISHFVSMLGHQWAMGNDHLETDVFNTKIKSWNFWIRSLNLICIILIFIGALILLNFINKNI